jgi:hypothetical protein
MPNHSPMTQDLLLFPGLGLSTSHSVRIAFSFSQSEPAHSCRTPTNLLRCDTVRRRERSRGTDAWPSVMPTIHIPKRKPGRPPKTKPPSGSPPPQDKDEEPSTPLLVVKRKPGRPPKPKPPPEDEEEAGTPRQPPKRKPGRPPKAKPPPDEDDDEGEASTPRLIINRKSGRTPKSKPEPKPPQPDEDEDEDEDELAITEYTPQRIAPKRPRGRPPKPKPDEDDEATTLRLMALAYPLPTSKPKDEKSESEEPDDDGELDRLRRKSTSTSAPVVGKKEKTLPAYNPRPTTTNAPKSNSRAVEQYTAYPLRVLKTVAELRDLPFREAMGDVRAEYRVALMADDLCREARKAAPSAGKPEVQGAPAKALHAQVSDSQKAEKRKEKRPEMHDLFRSEIKVPVDPVTGKKVYWSCWVWELGMLIKRRGIEIYWGVEKDEMVEALEEWDREPEGRMPPPPLRAW